MKPLIIANWKMNPKSLKEARALLSSVKKGIEGIKKAEIVICPPYHQFSIFNFQFSKDIKLGAQNVFWEREGAFTGEISPAMLKDSKCEYVIVGHSERRRYFGETNEIVNKKLKAVLKEKLRPVFCIGETKEQREKGEAEAVLKKQLELGLENISGFKFQSLGIIAYEPVWAIGTGNPCDVEEAQKMMLLIRKILSKIYSLSFSKKIPILYGGSVNSQNAQGYIKEADFNGLLVGGASLKAGEFVKIANLTCYKKFDSIT